MECLAPKRVVQLVRISPGLDFSWFGSMSIPLMRSVYSSASYNPSFRDVGSVRGGGQENIKDDGDDVVCNWKTRVGGKRVR